MERTNQDGVRQTLDWGAAVVCGLVAVWFLGVRFAPNCGVWRTLHTYPYNSD